MPFNAKQFDAARDFLSQGDNNISAPNDRMRVQCYNYYENVYINSTYMLKITLRGDESHPLLLPSARKLIEATNRFLGVNLDYLVEAQGDAGIQNALETWWKSFFDRESVKSKFESSKRWGLIRGDAFLYLYANTAKAVGNRISIAEIDPRQVFPIEDPTDPFNLIGYHIIQIVQDFREPNDVTKHVTQRRTFRKEQDDNGNFTGVVTMELSYWENSKWDDRISQGGLPLADLEAVAGGPHAQPAEALPPLITELPVYHWSNNPMQNSTWGMSQLTGLETLLYGINQSLTDEDATMVFQGMGMYVTTAAPPVDPATGQVTNWNIGPQQIIEIGTDQKFDRVTGVGDLKPFQDHINFIDEKGLSEAAGVPALAIGKVDVSSVQSGIALKMELMPLIAANAEKELEYINLLDQMFFDITTMWLPTYESETFGNAEAMAQASVVCLFDDPMPVDRDASIQETLLLQTSNLILTSMAVNKLRTLGWKYPATDANGNPLSDDDIARMLNDQATQAASAQDPFAASASNLGAFDSASGTTPPPGNLGNSIPNSPNGKQQIPLG
jgi:hypothetical protein